MRFSGWILSILLITCISTVSNPAFSQHIINCRQFTTDYGLSENVVYCMLQDKRRFIWMGTDFGLNQFDGYNFKKFYKNNYDPTSLSNNVVTSIVAMR